MIGVSGQYAAVDEYLTGRENLDMVGRLYHLRPRDSRRTGGRARRPLRSDRRRDRPVKTLLGRHAAPLDLACALVAARRSSSSTSRPPGSTRAAGSGMWDVITALVRGGTTVLLTTQYLEEADRSPTTSR